jgi:nucleoside-diphosphate-sugar epimerase
MTSNIALIAGATGAAASRLTELIAATPGWLAVGLCRNPPSASEAGAVRYIRTDFTSLDSCRAAVAAAGPVTHLIYAARAPFGEGGVEDVPANLGMFRNLLDCVETPALRHVHILEGGKWYGLHLGPIRSPSREDDPRHLPPNFYYDQQDLLTARRAGKTWSWSASRPQYRVDVAPVRARNLITVVGVYAAIGKALGAPFDFPGKPAAFNAVAEITDRTLLARFIFWAMTEPRAADQAFNVTNGDVFRWSGLWPRLTAYFGLHPGTIRRYRLERWMADKAGVWRDIAECGGLILPDINDVALLPYGDFVWGAEWDIVSSMSRARAAGFNLYEDTEDQFLRHLDAYRELKVLP